MRVPLHMLRLCEKYHAFWNAETYRATVRHWFIHMIMDFNWSYFTFLTRRKNMRLPLITFFQCSIPLYKSCQPCPWVPYGPALGRGVMGKSLKNLLLRNHKAQSFHILFLAMYSGPLYKSCQPCPWGPYGPRPGGVMGKT